MVTVWKYPAVTIHALLVCLFRFGMAGTVTQGHIDARDNFAYQVIGKKRWHLYSPQDFKHLYFTQLKGALEWSKALGEVPVNLKKYPRVKKARELTVVLNEGEVQCLGSGFSLSL